MEIKVRYKSGQSFTTSTENVDFFGVTFKTGRGWFHTRNADDDSVISRLSISASEARLMAYELLAFSEKLERDNRG